MLALFGSHDVMRWAGREQVPTTFYFIATRTGRTKGVSAGSSDSENESKRAGRAVVGDYFEY